MQLKDATFIVASIIEERNRGSSYDCPMRKFFVPVEGSMYYEDFTTDEGYCFKGTPK